MLKKCKLCGKGELNGKTVVRKGLAKKKGGTGSKIVRATKRKFFANLQKMRIMINDRAEKVFICAKCIKKGNFLRAKTRKSAA